MEEIHKMQQEERARERREAAKIKRHGTLPSLAVLLSSPLPHLVSGYTSMR